MWPAVQWYAARTRHASETRLEVLALFTALVYAWLGRTRSSIRCLWPAVWLTMAWGLASLCLPALLSTWVAWAAFAASVSALVMQRRFDVHLFGMLSLSLPVLPLFQYHLSYPLRTVVAGLSASFLRFSGFAVGREGACLSLGERLVWIDAPCSGLRMMWAGLFLASVLCAMHQVSALRTLVLFLVTVLAVVLANVLRTASLFFVELELVAVPDWSHSAVGIISYSVITVLLYWLVRPRKEEACVAHSPS